MISGLNHLTIKKEHYTENPEDRSLIITDSKIISKLDQFLSNRKPILLDFEIGEDDGNIVNFINILSLSVAYGLVDEASYSSNVVTLGAAATLTITKTNNIWKVTLG